MVLVMARPLRIEFRGAVYHVMARGNPGRAIYRDDRDRVRFLETLGEACEKTGWRLHAYVLMGNHYHLLVETPEGNLVAGMKWLQGTYTQRYNGRPQLRGHLFQGRYKAVPVEAENAGYLEVVSSYIHLNPARAGLIRIGRDKLKHYRWSSYPWYVGGGRGRPGWLERKRVMGALGLEPKEQRRYESHLESRVLELGLKAGRAELAGQWKALRRGWYVGGESFAEKLRGRIAGLLAGRGRETHSGGGKREPGERTAEELLEAGLARLGLVAADLRRGRKVTGEKAALAQWLRERTTVSLRWVSARLGMGHYSNAGRGPRKMRAADLRQLQQARSKLAAIGGKERGKHQ
jgi:REP element-mobilizing transposase RayT